MPARQGRPDDAVTVDIHATRRESLNGRLGVVERWLVYFRQRGFRRIRPRIQPDNSTGEAQHRSPDRTVRSRGDGVEAAAETLVLGGIDRLVGFHIRVPLA